MIAAPGDPERSRLSVVCQNWARVNYEFMIPAGAFVPAPEACLINSQTFLKQLPTNFQATLPLHTLIRVVNSTANIDPPTPSPPWLEV